MRRSRVPGQGHDDVDALITDQYLEALLAQADAASARTADGVRPAAAAAADPLEADDDANAADDASEMPADDASLRRAGAVLRASLLRAHPSFRFEERLAAQLADLAAGGSRAAVAGSGRTAAVIPFPGSGASASVPELDDPLLAAVLDGTLDPADEAAVARAAGLRSPARPLLVGGAITSAAISLVGVAWVAWRASRPGLTPMSRAARAAHARRIADLAELAAGVAPVAPRPVRSARVHGGPA